MYSKLEVIGLFLAFGMVWQHLFIVVPKRPREKWKATWRIYISQMIIAYSVAIIAIFWSLAWLLFRSEDAHNEYAQVLGEASIVTALLLTFFLTVLGLLINEILINPFLERYRLIRELWLTWFLLSVGMATFAGHYSGAISTQLWAHYIGGVMVGMTYFLWVYNAVYRQLTLREGFGGGFIRPLILKPINAHPPAQILVIGPKGTGKSEFIGQCNPLYGSTLERNEQEHGTRETTRLYFVPYPAMVSGSDGKEYQKIFCLGDTPGENLGDHVTLPFRYRTDVIVFMIRANSLHNQNGALEQEDNWKYIENFSARCCNSRSTVGKIARNYVSAWDLAMRRDASEDHSWRPGQILARKRLAPNIGSLLKWMFSKVDPRIGISEMKYDVSRFMLIVNYDSHDDREREIVSSIDRSHAKLLAETLGGRFGVREMDQCYGYICDVRVENTKLITDLPW